MKRREFLKFAFSSLFLFINPLKIVAGQRKRWAMAIDIYRCTGDKGCRDCIEACHGIHNVPSLPNERHEIKWIWLSRLDKVLEGEMDENLKVREVPILCNHCENPPCVKVCPTKATWRSEEGIVMMDYHRCIGCRYCMAACPYGSRSFNFIDPEAYIKRINREFPRRTKGVVEKCNFCEERLAKNLPPACVEACKEKALIFGDLNDPQSEIRRKMREKIALSRKSYLGTKPKVFYLYGGLVDRKGI